MEVAKGTSQWAWPGSIRLWDWRDRFRLTENKNPKKEVEMWKVYAI